MNFEQDKIEAFKAFFEERKNIIQSFDGCLHLELWQDIACPNIFFTYSTWETEMHLNHYRYSPFFKDTWSQTKAMFASKAKAWSVKDVTSQ